MTMPYLCQVSTQVSCSACCGLYNVPNLALADLETMLAERTDAFARLPRRTRAIEDFGRQQLGWSPHDRPFPHFHHCPYVGLIGRHRTRVGCLLHPDQPENSGRDWRRLSYYGAKACQTYFCPTTRRLDNEHQEILRTGIDHWYLYGLAITEHRLWSAFFMELKRRIGRKTTRDDFKAPEGGRGLKSFAALKLDWPFRRSGAKGPCNDFFDDEGVPRREVARTDQTLPILRYESIFRELDSQFASEGEMQRAEAVVTKIFDELTMILLV